MKSNIQLTALEEFLHQASEVGQTESESVSFTVDLFRAKKKLSQFQLPSDSAWILKVVQWAVASQASELVIALATRSTIITVSGVSTTAPQVVRALVELQSDTPAVNHLSTALRDVSMRQKRRFLMRLGDFEGIIWDGETLRRVEHKHSGSVKLEVALTADEKSRVRERRIGRGRNAALLKALVHRAHTCPVPLRCDGRRLDALEQNPNHGWGKKSQPLMLGALKGELPALPLPQHSSTSQSTYPVEQNLRKGRFPRQWQQESGNANLAFLITAHVELVYAGNNSKWVTRDGISELYWVLDGVVIESEPFGKRGLCSVGVFLSAQGLQTDISGFKLGQSPERAERRALAQELMREPCESAKDWSCEDGLKAADAFQQKLGALFVTVGLFSGAASIVKPLALIHSAAFLTGGVSLWRGGDAEFRALVKKIERALQEL